MSERRQKGTKSCGSDVKNRLNQQVSLPIDLSAISSGYPMAIDIQACQQNEIPDGRIKLPVYHLHPISCQTVFVILENYKYY